MASITTWTWQIPCSFGIAGSEKADKSDKQQEATSGQIVDEDEGILSKIKRRLFG